MFTLSSPFKFLKKIFEMFLLAIFLCLASASSVEMHNFEAAVNEMSGEDGAAARFMEATVALMARPCGDPAGNLCKYQQALAAGGLWPEIQAHVSKRNPTRK
jgi:hypothetical protein